MHDVGAAASAPVPHTPPRRAMCTPPPHKPERWVTPPYTGRAVQSAQPVRTLRTLHDDAPAVLLSRARPLPPLPAGADEAAGPPTTPPPAQPSSSVPAHTIFFGTPHTPEQGVVAALGGGAPTSLYDRTTPPPHTPSSDDGSPGVARAASPTDAHIAHRSLVREALGDVSNSPRRTPLRASTSPDDKPRATSTPLRTSSCTSPQTLTPVQSLLHDWAAARFAPTPQRTPSRSPLRMRPPARPAHHDVYTSPVRAAPSLASPERCAAGTPRAASAPSATPSPAGWIPGRTAVRRAPFAHERVPPQRVAVPLPAPPSPAKDGRGHNGTTGATDPVGASADSTAQPVAPVAAPSTARGTEAEAASAPGPERSARLARPVRYASHVPATRVWDSPEKAAKRARYAPSDAARAAAPSAPSSGAAPSVPLRAPLARRVPVERADGAARTLRPTGAVRTTRHSAHAAPSAAMPRTPATVPTDVAAAPASLPIVTPSVPPVPAEPDRAPPGTVEASGPAPPPTSVAAPTARSTQATALRARPPPPGPDALRGRPAPLPAAGAVPGRTAPVPRTPRMPRRVPAPPPLSAADLARLTTKHTKQNEQYTVELHTHELRMPGARPPSPSQAFHMDARPRTPHWTQPCWTETNEYGEPVRHAQGAGDVEPYVTPPHGARRVRWDKRLVVSPVRRRAPPAPRRTCLVPTERSLDAFGNVSRTGAAGARRRTVVVKRVVYEEDEEE
ncbi:hypothetical protein MBRA1_001478 [Malassezia brasiliensis]|uniref:Uncharacterized protein n=1 Tax=Malassezia brasiliensis TaxID=1821822 RepID=A0AAF0DU53_9BASI|nr:hypothetical protein MBRA1_001478 [Malassezia brasiliensis]